MESKQSSIVVHAQIFIFLKGFGLIQELKTKEFKNKIKSYPNCARSVTDNFTALGRLLKRRQTKKNAFEDRARGRYAIEVGREKLETDI